MGSRRWLDFERLHFIGIGGDGMSGLARVLHQDGRTISGSNIEENQRTRELRELGIDVHLGHREAFLRDAQAVVYSSAIAPGNIELQAARRRGLRVLPRLELLHYLTQSHTTIGVAGTHGKTTTTAMIALLLKAGGLDPTYLIGAASRSLGPHAHLGSGSHLVAEIDESDGHFLNLRPQMTVVTNIAPDHLNFYRDEENLYRSFARFVAQSEQALLCADDPRCRSILWGERQAGRVRATFAVSEEADLRARPREFHEQHSRFELYWQGQDVGEAELAVPGQHNIYNALAALLAGRLLGLDWRTMIEALRHFSLPERRFQFLAANGMHVIDDYAHLPEQVQVNLDAIRRGWNPGRVIAIFQPHRFTRTQFINGGFSKAFDQADLVFVTDIYPAFEQPIPGVDAQMIWRGIQRRWQSLGRSEASVHYVPDRDQLVATLRCAVRAGDFVIGFGAGDLWRELQRLAETLKGCHA